MLGQQVNQTSFYSFQQDITAAFRDEIDTNSNFKLYKLPNDFNDLNQRVLLDDEDKIVACLQQILDVGASQAKPLLYVFNRPNNAKYLETYKSNQVT